MKLALGLILFLAATQASPQRGVVKPRHILFPESALFPRMTGSEYEALLQANQPQPELTANFRPGTSRLQEESADKSYTDSKIIDGEDAALGQFPWQVAVTLDLSIFGAGSVISDSWVLTAGHCVFGLSTWTMVFGSLSPEGDAGSVTLMSRTAIVHNEYNNNTVKNDIGLIKLPSKLIWSNRIAPVRLPRHSYESLDLIGENIRVSGWGFTTDSNWTAVSPTLKFVDLTIVNNTVCDHLGAIVTSTNICVKGQGIKATCKGDSGGAASVREEDDQWTQVGIVSFGALMACEDRPDAFTRVPSYLSWIGDTTGIDIRN